MQKLPKIHELTPPELSMDSTTVAYLAPVAPQQEIEPDVPAVPLSHYFWVLRRHFWKIVVFVAACVLATAIVSSRMQRIYESTATVSIDTQTPSQVVGQELTQPFWFDWDTFLDTQINLIQSDSVLRPVAEQYHLLSADSQSGRGNSQAAQRLAAAPVSLPGLRVSRPKGTFLLQISYRSSDPHQAADLANAVVKSYLTHIYDVRIQSSINLSSFMEKQLDELKAKMEQSNLALAQFELGRHQSRGENECPFGTIAPVERGIHKRPSGQSQEGSSLEYYQVWISGGRAGFVSRGSPGKAQR